MISLILFVVYALVCIARIVYILRSEPTPATQEEQAELDQAALWWLSYPV